MAEKPEKDDDDKVVSVPQSLLVKMQEDMARLEREVEDGKARSAGIEEILALQKDEEGGEKKLRMKKNFEPTFRTVRLRKYPIGGDYENQGYVVGWTSRGAYQEIDKSGIAPEKVDFIDIIFLGHEKTKNGKIKAEKVKLLDLMNNGVQVHCKILETHREDGVITPTGEEIDVTTFDPQHGLLATGDKIDGYVTHSDIKYKLQVPGQTEGVWVDSMFCN